MRDKMIELIKRGGVIIPETAEAVADHLLSNNVFVLPDELENNLELTAKFLMGLFLNSEEEIEKTKEIFEFSQTKKILTDIRDYLVSKRDEITKQGLNLIITATALTILDAQILSLKEYAEKLGVEL